MFKALFLFVCAFAVFIPLERPIPGLVQILPKAISGKAIPKAPRVLLPYQAALDGLQLKRAKALLAKEQFYDRVLLGLSRTEHIHMEESRKDLVKDVIKLHSSVSKDALKQEDLVARFKSPISVGGSKILEQRIADLDHLQSLQSSLQDLIQTPDKIIVKGLDY